MPQPSTRFSTQEFQVDVQPIFSVGLTCLIPFTDRTLKSKDPKAYKCADVNGKNIEKRTCAPGKDYSKPRPFGGHDIAAVRAGGPR